MLSLETQQTSQTPSTPHNLSSKEEQENDSKLSFAQLLKGIKKTTKSTDEKIILDTNVKEVEVKLQSSDKKETKTSKKEMLLSLLHSNDKTKKGEEVTTLLELNPKLIENLSTTEIKKLIFDAKKFLKEQILQCEGYKKADIKELPKTLKGLTQLATKLNLDISKSLLNKFSQTKRYLN